MWSERRTGEETSFECADEESERDDGGGILHARETNRQRSPCEEQDAEPHGWADVVFHDPVAGDLEDGISDGEQRHCQRVAMRRKAGSLEHVVACLSVEDAGIANVAWAC